MYLMDVSKGELLVIAEVSYILVISEVKLLNSRKTTKQYPSIHNGHFALPDVVVQTGSENSVACTWREISAAYA